MKWLRVTAVLPVLLTSPACAPAQPEPRIPQVMAISGSTMGTTYTVKVAELPADATLVELRSAVDERLEWINRHMSTYVADSDVSRFSQHSGSDWFEVARETAFVVSVAQQIAEDTDGAFDITVGPLVNLWSFGVERRPDGLPTDQEIAARRSRVGYQNIEVRRAPPALRKQRPDVAIDLSGIAKGFAVDQIAELLDRRGIRGYMIEIGGEVRTRGHKADGGVWRIGIERPVSDSRAVYRVVALEDRSLASSGDYRNFFDWNGRRYSHEIDPQTGFPVDGQLAAVSVLAPDAMTADALATAYFVMGPTRAWQHAEKSQVEVLLILRDGDGFRERMTAGFSRCLLADQPAGTR
jgi:thiamine biosynthesis lipoprotein